MTAASTELKNLVAEARRVIEGQLDAADLLKGFREAATAKGFDWSQIKALLKAQILDERDGKQRVKAILEKADTATAYAGMLGWGEEVNENNFSGIAA